jgi:beta-galactosidase
MVTYDRKIKKDVFYFYKANWSDEPVIYITDRRFTPRPVGDGPVKVYSNCDSVTLSVNGDPLGTKTADDHIYLWPAVKLVLGDNDLTATGTRGGKQYSDTCRIVYDPSATTQPAATAGTAK